MIDMKSKDAIKLDTVPLDKKNSDETVLPDDGLYRYLYQPGEQHRDQKDEEQTLSGENTYRSHRVVQEPGNRILYFLQDKTGRAFVLGELMHVSESTYVLPDWVSEWK